MSCRARFRDRFLVLGAGAGAVSWLCTWSRQVAGAGAGPGCWVLGTGCRCWCCELAVHAVETGCWCWCRVPGADQENIAWWTFGQVVDHVWGRHCAKKANATSRSCQHGRSVLLVILNEPKVLTLARHVHSNMPSSASSATREKDRENIILSYTIKHISTCHTLSCLKIQCNKLFEVRKNTQAKEQLSSPAECSSTCRPNGDRVFFI